MPAQAIRSIRATAHWILAFAGMSGKSHALRHQPLLARMRKPIVERATQAFEQLLDLGLGDDQRRAYGDRIADIADDHPVFERARLNKGQKAALRIERL